MTGTVYLVGAGPGDAGLLTLRGAEVLAQADIVIYDWLVNPSLLEFAPQAEKIYVGKNTHARHDAHHYVEQGETNQLLVNLARQGKKIVRLKGGDPFIFGRGGEEASYLNQRKIPFEIVPGVSAGYAVPAYAGIPVTDRRFASSVTFATGHEDPTKKEASVNWQALAKTGGTLVCFMGVKNLPSLVSELKKGGMSTSKPVSVIEWGTLPAQRVVSGTLADIVKKVRDENIQSPAVTVIGEVNRFRKQLNWFEKRPLFGKKVIVTRARAQASGLRKQLESLGAQVLEFPTIKILPPDDWNPLDEAIRNIERFEWIIFTSVNGVEYFFNRLEAHHHLDARALSHAKIAVIGDATEAALREQGIRADVMPDHFTSESLLAALKKNNQIRNQHFLLPRTDIAPDYLAKKIDGEWGRVTEVVAYRTVPAPEAKTKLLHELKTKKVDYVLFTSSSTVKNFFDPLTKEERKKVQAKLISIGPMTTQTLKEYGVKPYREAQNHTIPGLVEILLKTR